MEDIIKIDDVNLAVKIRDALEKSGHRNSKFTFADYNKFTAEELSTIESLKFDNEPVKDISALKYCKNLKELSIISANAKAMQVNLSEEEIKSNYALKQSKIQDFSSIEGLENLEILTIKNVDNLEKLDITKLKKLASLELTGNSNLEEIEGLDEALEISDLTLYRNNISKSFDIENMIENGMLSNIKLDFDMYPLLKKQNQNLAEMLMEKQKDGISCKWEENLSNIRLNELPTMKIEEMDKKVEGILNSAIGPEYSDIEKLSAIYAYIIENVQYDYDSIDASNGKENKTLEEARSDLSARTETILDRRQSSYNAIMKGTSVCEGYTNMMHYLLKSVGIDSRTCSCSADIQETIVGANSNHSVIKAQIGEDWYYFDPTWDAEASKLKNFFKTKEEFSTNHVLSMTEENVKSPTNKAYTNQELTEIINKVREDRYSKRNEELNNKQEIKNNEKEDKFSIDDLVEAYKNQEINKEDLDRMKEILRRTKENRQQIKEQEQTSNFENR